MAKSQIKNTKGGIFEALMAIGKKNHLFVSEVDSFRIWGISSHEKPARFAWFLNRMRALEFSRIDDFILQRGKISLAFLLFSAKGDLPDSDYLLVKNYSGLSYLIPDFKAIDYILMVRYDEDPPNFNPIEVFSKLPAVQVCFEIKTDKLKTTTKNELFELYDYKYKTHQNQDYSDYRAGNSRIRNIIENNKSRG